MIVDVENELLNAKKNFNLPIYNVRTAANADAAEIKLFNGYWLSTLIHSNDLIVELGDCFC